MEAFREQQRPWSPSTLNVFYALCNNWEMKILGVSCRNSSGCIGACVLNVYILFLGERNYICNKVPLSIKRILLAFTRCLSNYKTRKVTWYHKDLQQLYYGEDFEHNFNSAKDRTNLRFPNLLVVVSFCKTKKSKLYKAAHCQSSQ